MVRTCVVALLLALCGAGCRRSATVLDERNTRTVVLPGGQKIRVEVMTHPTDMMRGMMFRDSLEPDRGMLFIHGSPGNYPYWMYQVRIPLDIIWLDERRRIVEIYANAPPCRTKASECPSYGGNQKALYVLELAGGMAEKYGLRIGDVLVF
ncbi:MAG: DUF192 domain-containing protein [Bryobacterales bacterium]|nr:DUF192 domain-containing protein [Bryobacteraceae bacterium]MDW8130737.1 DUF192 domain-containing protein [Bryobacterales bacterium]